jgi:hypothetical protein
VLVPLLAARAAAPLQTQVLDLPTRPGVTQRMILIVPDAPRAALILLAGGAGGLRIDAQGALGGGQGNFLVRMRERFAEQGLAVAVVDAPSDRQQPPYLDGFRMTAAHAADLRATLVELRRRYGVPVWLVGTSRGTESAAAVAVALADTPDAPDGVVLTSTLLRERNGMAVTAMALDRLRAPVLVVHHERDACWACPPSDLPWLMRRLSNSPRKALRLFAGGTPKGEPCEAYAYHGYNGIEDEVVGAIAQWILAP